MANAGSRAIAVMTAVAFMAGCASSTLIKSSPPGAKVYLNGEMVGRTPYTMADTKVVGSTTQVRLELEGYESFSTVISRNEQFSVGACIGGVLVLVPFLWIMDYKPEHSYELTPLKAPRASRNPATLPLAWQSPLAP